MTTRGTAGDVGVWYRPGGSRRWHLAALAPDAEQARQKMFDLMGSRRSGDWTVAPASDPPHRERGRLTGCGRARST